GKEYAILISTCAGAWRYLIGDVIRFSNKEKSEIIITGRTKHYISLCGEHLSVENMNRAISEVQEEFNISIPEFAVAGITENNRFGHQWYLGTDDPMDAEKLVAAIDEKLKVLNDDYATERAHALKSIKGKVYPHSYFLKYLETKGKLGGSHKFPRVLKAHQIEEFEKLIQNLEGTT
ncbi:MAG TPA: GH3 auxin-responsive promoter family protein, partial [Catalimonadaceae bacterium]|nr:GH3 auxin-responsive promoter family protein [Catalimonadaceae bacterium]